MATLMGKKLGPKEEILLSAGVMLLAALIWYFFLYTPIVEKTAELKGLIASQEDSLRAVQKYKLNVATLQVKIANLDTSIAEWDARFPERTQIVALATQILNFGSDHNLDLVEVKPSLFELYALE